MVFSEEEFTDLMSIEHQGEDLEKDIKPFFAKTKKGKSEKGVSSWTFRKSCAKGN